MAQLEVRFTLHNEINETTFKLFNSGNGFFLRGRDSSGEDHAIYLSYDIETNVFKLINDNTFEEPQDVIDARLVGLSEEWIEVQSQGLDSNDSIEEPKQKPGYTPNDIYVENKPFSLSQIIDMVDEGDLEVAPNFQRHFVWDRTRQSRLIESILMGLPLPSIFLSQYKDGRLTIVDGLQRIRTIIDFMKNNLTLCNMEYLEDCNGKTYSQLKEVLSMLQLRRFRQTQIMCFVIDYRSPSKLKYDLFRRLNTGGKALNDQEIRNCLSREPLQQLLNKMVTSESFQKATGGSVKDTRMAAHESALRFIYFYDQYSENNPIGAYNGDMSGSLDDLVEELNGYSENHLSTYSIAWERGMSSAFSVFDKFAFRKLEFFDNKLKKYSINKSLLLSISVLLAHHYNEYKEKIEASTDLTEQMADLLAHDNKLSTAISWSTSDKPNILYTMECLKEKLFDKYLK